MKNLRVFFRDKQASTAIEYAVIIAGIGVVVAGAVMLLGSFVAQFLGSAASFVVNDVVR